MSFKVLTLKKSQPQICFKDRVTSKQNFHRAIIKTKKQI